MTKFKFKVTVHFEINTANTLTENGKEKAQLLIA